MYMIYTYILADNGQKKKRSHEFERGKIHGMCGKKRNGGEKITSYI